MKSRARRFERRKYSKNYHALRALNVYLWPATRAFPVNVLLLRLWLSGFFCCSSPLAHCFPLPAAVCYIRRRYQKYLYIWARADGGPAATVPQLWRARSRQPAGPGRTAARELTATLCPWGRRLDFSGESKLKHSSHSSLSLRTRLPIVYVKFVNHPANVRSWNLQCSLPSVSLAIAQIISD